MQVDQEMLFEIILVSRQSSLFRPIYADLVSIGGQLLGYQGTLGCRLQDSRQHDQGQVP